MKDSTGSGAFLDVRGERWYRIEACDRMEPFFMALTDDSNLWAFISTTGSLAAGWRDQEQSFSPTRPSTRSIPGGSLRGLTRGSGGARRAGQRGGGEGLAAASLRLVRLSAPPVQKTPLNPELRGDHYH